MAASPSPRRSLLRGAAWTVPVILASTASPALAVSRQPVRMLWSGFPRATLSRRLAEPASQTVDGVVVTATLERPRQLVHPGDNWTAADGRLTLQSNDVTTGSSEQIVTLTFNAPVTKVSLTVEEIDRGSSPDFADEVYVPAGAPRTTEHSAGAKVTGAGTPENPFRATPDVAGKATGPDHAVTLRWAGPVKQIRIGYRQGVRSNAGANPTIRISPVTFTPTGG